MRFGEPVHVFNNYYRNNSYGIASTMNAGMVVEGNYFENIHNPMRVNFSGDPGRIVERNNICVNCNNPFETAGMVVEPRTYYSYTVDSAASVPAIVQAGAGVGKLN